MVRRSGYKLEEVYIKGEGWVDRGARKVAHLNQLYARWIALADG